uniref:Uncharacterized protein n=1 Tax=Knipowitschia caucasica TaxID=637954 RepID=A0AAV2L8A1_KNICA
MPIRQAVRQVRNISPNTGRYIEARHIRLSGYIRQTHQQIHQQNSRPIHQADTSGPIHQADTSGRYIRPIQSEPIRSADTSGHIHQADYSGRHIRRHIRPTHQQIHQRPTHQPTITPGRHIIRPPDTSGRHIRPTTGNPSGQADTSGRPSRPTQSAEHQADTSADTSAVSHQDRDIRPHIRPISSGRYISRYTHQSLHIQADNQADIRHIRQADTFRPIRQADYVWPICQPIRQADTQVDYVRPILKPIRQPTITSGRYIADTSGIADTQPLRRDTSARTQADLYQANLSRYVRPRTRQIHHSETQADTSRPIHPGRNIQADTSGRHISRHDHRYIWTDTSGNTSGRSII